MGRKAADGAKEMEDVKAEKEPETVQKCKKENSKEKTERGTVSGRKK